MTSAVIGPMRTRTRLPTLDDGADLALDQVHRRVLLVQAPDRDLPRVDDDADLAFAPLGRVDELARLEVHERHVVVEPARVAAQQVRAGERGDERVGGVDPRARSDVANWRSLPSTITPTWSASAAASSKSCVTRIVGSASSRRSSWSSARTVALRVRVERGERLVEQDHARAARERARERDPLALAARERGRSARRRGARCGSARGTRRRAPCRRTRRSGARVRCGKSAYSWKTSPTRRSSGLRKTLPLAVEPDVVAERDLSARRTDEAGDRAQHRRLAGARRPDEGDGAVDVER